MKADFSIRTMRGFSRHRLYLGLFTALALAADFPVHAQQTPSVSEAPQQYSIAAGGLGDALNQLGTQSRLQIVYAPELVEGKTAPAIDGRLTWRNALEKLLAGSGLEWRLIGHNLVALRKATASTLSAPPAQRAVHAAATQDQPSMDNAKTLKSVTVLGSLLPRAQVETASPLIVITAEDIKARGFSSVADALQNLTISTGATNNTSINAGDVWAGKFISLFGLDGSYTKYLINGRPMPHFSTPGQGTQEDQLYTNLSGIPIDLVERIEILPGGQSSLYGADAVAGVVNVVLKKHAQAATLDARYGSYSGGGGRERKLSASDTFQVGKLNLMIGAQVNDQQPMWNFQRAITAQNFAGGINPQQAGQDVQATGFSGITYFPTQPSDCQRLAGLWGGTERYYPNAQYGASCGSVSDLAYATLLNKDQAASLNVHADYDVNDNIQLYADFLESYEKQAQPVSPFYSSVFYDANLQDDVFVTRRFAPEEMAGNLDGLLDQKNYENTYTSTLGGKVDFGDNWNLDVGFTRAYERNDSRQLGLLANNVPGSFGSTLLGPQLGTDALGYPIYAPNYDVLTTPVTPAQFAGYARAASIASTDRNDQLRAQLTQTSLFSLPGGDAGLALVAEEGFESWKYLPSQLLSSGELQAISLNPSDGHRTRYAAASELNLPLFKMLTADLSARYDSYDAEGAHFSKPTYSLGLEFRPVDTLLLRGRYSTSFKAPTLIDEFEGGSKGQNSATDFLSCARLGFTGANAGNCPAPYALEPITLTQTGNPYLQPMTAKSLSYGVVWSPTANLSLRVDYQHISIRNEVLKESTNFLTQTELYCANGTLDPSSPSCRAANAQITRAPAAPGSPLPGRILAIVANKVNVAHEVDNSLTAGFDYGFGLGRYGRLGLNMNYTRVLTHRQQQFPGDPEIDYLNAPGFSTDFQTKANAELTWSRGKWSATLFGSYFGPTPNYVAEINNGYNVPYAGHVAAWRIYNTSVNYSPTHAWQLSLHVNNIKNSMPPIDITQPGNANLPFNVGNYNPYGREISIEARYQFGLSAHQ